MEHKPGSRRSGRRSVDLVDLSPSYESRAEPEPSHVRTPSYESRAALDELDELLAQQVSRGSSRGGGGSGGRSSRTMSGELGGYAQNYLPMAEPTSWQVEPPLPSSSGLLAEDERRCSRPSSVEWRGGSGGGSSGGGSSGMGGITVDYSGGGGGSGNGSGGSGGGGGSESGEMGVFASSPCGQQLQVDILSTWGDPFYVGLSAGNKD